VNLAPVVLKFRKYLFQGFGEGGLQVRVIIQVNVKMVTDSVLNFSRFGLATASLVYLLLEVLVQN
jgi:hypothetical protein